ncbi:MAG: hypothetical protein WA860_14075 [Acidimicrobiales bacterium]
MCNKINPLCDFGDLAGHVGSSVASTVFSSIATAFGNTADSAVNWLWEQLSASTTVSLGGANFELDLGIVVSIAVVFCLGLFVIQVAVSALRRDAGGIGRALRGLVIATVGCAMTLASLNVLLAGVDQLCSGIVKVATGATIATLGTKIVGDAVFTTAFASPPTILILSLFTIVAVAIVWFALVIRKMLILIAAIFAPLAFAGGVADLSRGWVRKWLEGMLALVFSKLILIIIFVIGLGVLGGMGSGSGGSALNSITGEITGLLILLVAGFSPWMALRLVHFTGDHMATLAQSAGHANAGASTVVSAPQKMSQLKYSAGSLGGHIRPSSSTAGTGSGSHGGGALSAVTASDTLSAGAPLGHSVSRVAASGTTSTATGGSGAPSHGFDERNRGGGASPAAGVRSESSAAPPKSDAGAGRTTPRGAPTTASSPDSAGPRLEPGASPMASARPKESGEQTSPVPPAPPHRPVPPAGVNPSEEGRE